MIGAYRDLFIHTVRDPGDAARRILLMNLPPRAVWLAMLLSVVLNTLAFQTSLIVAPPDGEVIVLMASPGAVFIMLLAILVVVGIAFTWLGRALGGHGTLVPVMTLLTWLQLMRVAVQVAAIVLLMVSPVLSNLLILGAGIYGIYILTHFMNEAHGFGALSRAFLMILLGVLGLVMGLSMILTVIGATAMGLSGNV